MLNCLGTATLCKSFFRPSFVFLPPTSSSHTSFSHTHSARGGSRHHEEAWPLYWDQPNSSNRLPTTNTCSRSIKRRPSKILAVTSSPTANSYSHLATWPRNKVTHYRHPVSTGSTAYPFRTWFDWHSWSSSTGSLTFSAGCEACTARDSRSQHPQQYRLSPYRGRAGKQASFAAYIGLSPRRADRTSRILPPLRRLFAQDYTFWLRTVLQQEYRN